MPELPEVETVRRTLAAVLPGRTIETVYVALPRLIKNASPTDFAAALCGQENICALSLTVPVIFSYICV